MRLSHALAALALLASGCRTPDAPLYEYNRSWEGELRLRDRTLPLHLRLYVLPSDRADALKDRYPDQHVFAEIEIASFGPIAAMGGASHNDFSGRGTYPPHVPTREFIELETSSANALVEESESPPASESYSTRYRALLALVGSKSAMQRAKLVFVGELGADKKLEGLVFLDESAEGDCVRSVGGKCDMWNVRSTEIKVGTFSAKLDGYPGFVPVADGVETPTFRFSRESVGSDTKSWMVTLRRDGEAH